MQHWQQGLLGGANNDQRAVGRPGPAPTALASALASADAAAGRKEMRWVLQRHRKGSVHSGACQAQAGAHVGGRHEKCWNPLLECTEPGFRVQSWKWPGRSCSARAQQVPKGSTHWKMGLPLAGAVTEVSAEARGILGSCPQHSCEAQAVPGAEETLVGPSPAREGCFWMNCPVRCSEAPVY